PGRHRPRTSPAGVPPPRGTAADRAPQVLASERATTPPPPPAPHRGCTVYLAIRQAHGMCCARREGAKEKSEKSEQSVPKGTNRMSAFRGVRCHISCG